MRLRPSLSLALVAIDFSRCTYGLVLPEMRSDLGWSYAVAGLQPRRTASATCWERSRLLPSRPGSMKRTLFVGWIALGLSLRSTGLTTFTPAVMTSTCVDRPGVWSRQRRGRKPLGPHRDMRSWGSTLLEAISGLIRLMRLRASSIYVLMQTLPDHRRITHSRNQEETDGHQEDTTARQVEYRRARDTAGSGTMRP